MDRPAAVTATLLGIALIAVSLPFLLAEDAGSTDYVISWTQGLESSTQVAASATENAVTTLRAPVTDAQPANATIELTACTDAATAPVQSTATLTWTLYEGSSTSAIGQGTATCASTGPFRVALGGHGDVGSTSADSADAAAASAYDAGDNRTTEYRLEFSWDRPDPPAGLPVPQPAFSAQVRLTVDAWLATANPATEDLR